VKITTQFILTTAFSTVSVINHQHMSAKLKQIHKKFTLLKIKKMQNAEC